ncbi:MAG: Nif3-like dinuclear metal center hexameric protein [Candidatus Ratteibacteria bacterium]
MNQNAVKGVRRDDLIQFLDTLLQTKEIQDNSWNGLQIEGKETVKKIAFSVDASYESFQAAIAEEADFLIVHHGLFWKGQNPSLKAWMKKRVDSLYAHHVSLYASHLPLDCHPVVGNNIQLLHMVNARPKEGFGWYEGRTIGWVGSFSSPTTISQIEKDLQHGLKQPLLSILPFGPAEIKSIAVCSGGANLSFFYEALTSQADLFLTGESRDIYAIAKDAGIHVIFAGHHLSETVGLNALAKEIKKEFPVETVDCHIPTRL